MGGEVYSVELCNPAHGTCHADGPSGRAAARLFGVARKTVLTTMQHAVPRENFDAAGLAGFVLVPNLARLKHPLQSRTPGSIRKPRAWFASRVLFWTRRSRS